MNDLWVISPMLILAVVGGLSLLLDLFLPAARKSMLAYLSLLGLGAAILANLALGHGTRSAFGGAVGIDPLAYFANWILLLSAVLAVLIGQRYLVDLDMEHGEHYALILFATLGGMLMAAGRDLLIVFLGLEVLSLSLYVLAGYRRTDLLSQEAALKYLLLGAFASSFLLYGIALLYGATGTTSLEVLGATLAGRAGGVDLLLILGVGLLGIGLAFKVALVPFHMWTPDVYEGAPSSVTAYMSVAAKAAGFAAVLRIYPQALGTVVSDWAPLFAVLAALTMSVGNIIALAQSNIKRLLAYSGIAHAGYILMGVVASDDFGVASALYYLLAYTFMNLGAFAVLIALREGEREYLSLNDYQGLGHRLPWLGASMALFMLSLAGVPPTAGFLAKVYVFGAAVQAGYLWLAVVAVLNSVVAAFYYLRVIVIMYMREQGAQPVPVSLSPSLALALLLTAWGTLQLGLWPTPVLEMAQESFASLLGV